MRTLVTVTLAIGVLLLIGVLIVIAVVLSGKFRADREGDHRDGW